MIPRTSVGACYWASFTWCKMIHKISLILLQSGEWKKKYIFGNYTDQYYRSKGDINIGNKMLSCWCTHTRYEGCHHCRRMTVYKHMAIKQQFFLQCLQPLHWQRLKEFTFNIFFFYWNLVNFCVTSTRHHWWHFPEFWINFLLPW